MKTTLLLLCLITFLALPASANWGGDTIGHGATGNFKVKGGENISMDEEMLNIDLYYNHALVEVRYRMTNHGPKTKVTAAFPAFSFALPDMMEESFKGPSLDVKNYVIEVDGKKIASRTEAGDALPQDQVPAFFSGRDMTFYRHWITSTVDFGADQTRNITIRYKAPYHVFSAGVSDVDDTSATMFYYLLSTGGVWKGPIQKGEVRVRPIAVRKRYLKMPAEFKEDGDAYVWKFSDLEPTAANDIAIQIAPSEKTFPAMMPPEPGMDEHEYSGLYIIRDSEYLWRNSNFTATASSTLDPAEQYAAKNVGDVDDSTAWCEGKPDDGIGESLTLTLAKPEKVAAIQIMPGYGKSDEIWKNNNRVAKLEVLFDGKSLGTYSIPDESAPFYYLIDLPSARDPVKEITLVIREVYRGVKFRDTCIGSIAVDTPLTKKPAVPAVR